MKLPIARTMIVPLIVASALFMENLDSTVITTALPQMAVTFDTTPIHLSIGITAYVLSLAIFIPVSGWVADRFGARTVFRIAITVFTIGSVLCGLCNDVAELAAARVLQGMGGAMMVPVGRLIMFRSVAKAEFVTAMAYLTIPAMVGPTLGPPIGGFITTYASWRWIFFLNVPVGLLGVALVTRFIENYREPQTPSLDWRGFLLTGTALACFVYVCDLVERPEVDWTAVAMLLGVSIVAGLVSARHLRRTPYPVIDLTLLRVPTFAASVVGGAIFRVGTASLNYLLPILLQLGLGFNAFESGLLTVAGALGSFAMKVAAIRILRRWGFRLALFANAVISAAGVAICVVFNPAMPFVAIFLILLVTGFFRSLQYTALNSMAFADIPASRMSAASSFSSMLQQISNGMGVAFAAMALNLVLVLRGDPQSAMSLDDMRITLVLMAIVTLASSRSFARLAPDAGDEVSGHRAAAE
ncbi:MAG TPA: DHA2 family efflux MFS transporter permease subunit [Stellaceae bacterium]|nr:DHA2 family efflux MFS transporter permease subunit [Stellaceae bacterium]